MRSRNPFAAIAVSLGLSVLALETLPRLVEIPGLSDRDLDPISFELSKANIAPHPYLAYANRAGYKSREGAKQDRKSVV